VALTSRGLNANFPIVGHANMRDQCRIVLLRFRREILPATVALAQELSAAAGANPQLNSSPRGPRARSYGFFPAVSRPLLFTVFRSAICDCYQ